MKKIRVLAVLAAGMCSLLTGMAQDADAPLSIKAAVALALNRNPQMLVALAEQEELKGTIKEVRSEAFPQITFQGYGLRMRDPASSIALSLTMCRRNLKMRWCRSPAIYSI